ncbi:hypothetical protein ACFWRV_13265 [Streptomyces sp. NPDC058576]|uniref:hypothetical protein n=1 Tax=Streptomyces sp. NPDC058576 TaxID=3346547 RepID=UPI0036624757
MSGFSIYWVHRGLHSRSWGGGTFFTELKADPGALGLDSLLGWQKRLTDADRRALSPQRWTHVNPYGRFELDMNSHLALAATASPVPGPRSVLKAEAARSAADGGSGSAS